ncbi:MAG: hypothetical protein OQK65_08830, partial [Chlorobium sp.]|nr:hypothetical protein [Chlorobium sp.]
MNARAYGKEMSEIVKYVKVINSNNEILKLSKIIVLKRKSSHAPPFKDKYYRQAVFVQTRGIEISATDIRERVKHGMPINFLVPPTVMEYIYKQKLYNE